MLLRTAAVSILLLLSSCAGGDGADGGGLPEPCSVKAELSGAVEASFTGNGDVACLTQHSLDSGLDVTFLKPTGQASLELNISDVAEGMTGANFPTRVVARLDAFRYQASDCSVSIDEHRLLESEASEIGELRRHQANGKGNCAAPLQSVADPAMAEVTLAPFEFRAQFTWRD